MDKKGLKQRILSARNSEEIASLLDEGKAFQFASVQTRSSWQNAAERRRRALGSESKS